MGRHPAVRACDVLIESCWLLALVTVPIFFDTMTVRIFEPDKIALFRNIVIVMVLLALARLVLVAPSWFARQPGDRESARPPWWRALLERWPLFLPVAVFVVVYTAATINSVLPAISFWGSYDRMQGLYTWLNYVALFLVIALHLRTWPQIERIVSALVFTSIPVAAYGIIQHMQWDQIQWGAPTTDRVASTLGNSIFLGAYLIMCMPFTIYRLVRAYERWRSASSAPAAIEPAAPRRPSEREAAQQGRGRSRGAAAQQRRPERRNDIIEIDLFPPVMPVIGYALILLLEFAALFYCGSRGPYYGFVAGTIVLGGALTLKLHNPFPAIAALFGAVALYLYPQVTTTVNAGVAGILLILCLAGIVAIFVLPQIRSTLKPALSGLALVLVIFSFPQSVNVLSSTASNATDNQHLTDINSPTSDVRLFIWEGSLGLIKERPILGWGPETMIYVYSKYYPSGLGHIERANAAPDRNHDEEMDFLVFSGVLGLLAWLAILGTFAWMMIKTMQRALSRRAILLCACIMAVVAGHLVEGLVGIGIVSTLMVLWTMFALAAVLYARPELVGAATQATTATPPAVEVPQPRTPRHRQGRPASSQRQTRGQAPPPPPRISFDRLTGAQQGVLVGLIVLLLAALVGGILLFSNNVQVVRADAYYKVAQSTDTIAVACLDRALNPSASDAGMCPAATSMTQQQILNAVGTNLLPTAINNYQQAVATQPNQDMYYLWLGKTYLDQARYYQAIGQQQNAFSYFQQAADILMSARKINPYNADHPMNLGRMYAGWAPFDPSKWKLADYWFRIATALARHNGRWWDEWGAADMRQATIGPAQGIKPPTLTAAQKTALFRQALAAFQHACQVDDLLGDARIYRAQAYDALGMHKEAAASYTEAAKVGGFEIFHLQDAVAGMVNDLYATKQYRALVTKIPVNFGNGIGFQSPLTLAYSPTLGLAAPTSPLTPTLQAISNTLRQKGIAG
ncbi:MAG TPA: O-antigen ligase family protein [Chloroflexota bacterium]|nr:O-antigen ligase family protein [Chloroflexota bacterium]